MRGACRPGLGRGHASSSHKIIMILFCYGAYYIRTTRTEPTLSSISEARSPEIRAFPGSGARIGYGQIWPLAAMIDVIIITLASVSTGAGYHSLMANEIGSLETHASLGLVTGVFYLAAAHHLGLYRIQELFRKSHDLRRTLASWALAILFLSIVLFVLKMGSSVSRGSVICFAALGGVCLVSWRTLAKRRLARALAMGAIRGRRAVLCGDSEELALFGRDDLLARFGIDEVERIVLLSTKPVQTNFNATEYAMRVARESGAEEIILALPWSNHAQLEVIRRHLRVSALPVRLLPDRAVSAVLAHDAAGPAELLLVQIQREPLSSAERAAKRALDIVIACCTILALAPLMALTALAVKLESKGPIVFRQRRNGFNGKEFTIFKFRTMMVLEDGPSIVQASRGDRRVTRLGRLLRQTSIDELPQLFNVIKGNMSIVGPRPHAVAHDDEYGQLIANYAFRHHVKPGITGWAQVHGYRGATPHIENMAKRIELDLWYVNHWSLNLDLEIILRTILELMRRRNAY